METNQKNNYPEYIEMEYVFDISSGFASERIDVFLSNSIKNATRTKVQKAIEAGNVTINGKQVKSNKKIKPGDRILCTLLKPPPIELVPEDIPLNIKYEDDYLLVVDKPKGMVVHPAFGNRYGTLVNAVLYHLGLRESIVIESEEDENANEDALFFNDSIRPGLVHRLDKDTSGLILISKNPEIHAQLAAQFAERRVEKYYTAMVWGKFKQEHNIIENNIGRSSKDRKLFAVVNTGGKSSKTEYWVEKNYNYMSLIKIKLWTGRTHQIRVHFAHKNNPLVGDTQYGGSSIRLGGHNAEFRIAANKILNSCSGQMLHAGALKFIHPVKNEEISINSELPTQFLDVIKLLDDFHSDKN